MMVNRLNDGVWDRRTPTTHKPGLFGRPPKPVVWASSDIKVGADYKSKLICNFPMVEMLLAKRSYTMHPGIGEHVVDLLVNGVNPSKVAHILNISPSLESYHRGKAIRDLVIVREEGSFPHLYKRGARYAKGLYKKRRGRRCSHFVIPEARVHAGNGDLYRIKAMEGDMHEIKVSSDRIRLFPMNPVGIMGRRHYNAEIEVPANLLGYEGGRATLHFYPSHHATQPGLLMVSPPEMRLNLEQLTAANLTALFTPTYEYVRMLLEVHGGWRFVEMSQMGEIHYAFSRQMVLPFLPGLINPEMVKPLERGESETERILFIDQSVPGGELETTEAGIASDILAMLMVGYKAEVTGGGAH